MGAIGDGEFDDDTKSKDIMIRTSREIKAMNMRLAKLFAPGKKLLDLVPDGSSFEFHMSEGENMYARINLKGIREALVFSFKVLEHHPQSDCKVYFSTKVPNPGESHHDAVFHNVSVSFNNHSIEAEVQV